MRNGDIWLALNFKDPKINLVKLISYLSFETMIEPTKKLAHAKDKSSLYNNWSEFNTDDELKLSLWMTVIIAVADSCEYG